MLLSGGKLCGWPIAGTDLLVRWVSFQIPCRRCIVMRVCYLLAARPGRRYDHIRLPSCCSYGRLRPHSVQWHSPCHCRSNDGVFALHWSFSCHCPSEITSPLDLIDAYTSWSLIRTPITVARAMSFSLGAQQSYHLR